MPYATPSLKLVIDNNKDLLDHAIAMARTMRQKHKPVGELRLKLADQLKEWIEEHIEIVFQDLPTTPATELCQQLAESALSHADWRELADHYLNKLKYCT